MSATYSLVLNINLAEGDIQEGMARTGLARKELLDSFLEDLIKDSGMIGLGVTSATYEDKGEE